MLRGITIFFCDNCRKRFKGLDMEYRCTILTSPQRCPYCGSYHTLPRNSVGFQDSLYATIWKNMDESGEYGTTCSIDPKRYLQYIEECDEWNSKPHDNDDDDDNDNNDNDYHKPEKHECEPDNTSKSKLQEAGEWTLLIFIVILISIYDGLYSIGKKLGKVFKRK